MRKNIISSCFPFAFSLAMILFASCTSDNDEACYFKMETEQTQVNVPAAGISKSKLAKVIIRSNKDWNIQLENPEDAQWIHLFANEGSADGIFRFWVEKNTEFTSRSARLIFTVDGQKQDVPYTIDQAADVPAVTIANAENGYKVLATGGQLKVPVSHNIEWTTLLKDEMNQQPTWIKIDSCGTDSIYLSLWRRTLMILALPSSLVQVWENMLPSRVQPSLSKPMLASISTIASTGCRKVKRTITTTIQNKASPYGLKKNYHMAGPLLPLQILVYMEVWGI